MNNIIVDRFSDGLKIDIEIKDAGPRGLQGIPGPAGTTDYKELINLPLINSVTLIDDLSFTDLGIGKIENSLINNLF